MFANNKVYLKLDKRVKWDGSEKTGIGYYDLKIPKKQLLRFRNLDDLDIEKIKEKFGADIDKIKDYDDEIFISCNMGKGYYVNDLYVVYNIKNEIEERVKEKFNGTNVYDYTLIVKLTTLS